MIHKISLGLDALVAYLRKLKVDIYGAGHMVPLQRSHGTPEVVVSLTSYGRRVKTNVVYYTLISLLNQTYRPNRIILWLDRDNWNKENIPTKLKSLLPYGIEIHFCEDIRSYKKLIPTLHLCPDDIIITVDDDTMYNKVFVEELIKWHRDYPKCIVSSIGYVPVVDGRIIQPYRQWTEIKKYRKGLSVFGVGVNGILYPPHSLHVDVLDIKRAMELAPIADDIWFWIQSVRKGTHHLNIEINYKNHSFDSLYQYFHRGTALTHTNNLECANDKQLDALLNYYGIKEQIIEIINNERIQ